MADCFSHKHQSHIKQLCHVLHTEMFNNYYFIDHNAKLHICTIFQEKQLNVFFESGLFVLKCLTVLQNMRAVPDENMRGSLKAKHYIVVGLVEVGCFSIQWVVVFHENVICWWLSFSKYSSVGILCSNGILWVVWV